MQTTSRLPEILTVPGAHHDGIFLEALADGDQGELEGFLGANRAHLANFAVFFSGAGISEEAARLIGGASDDLMYKIMHRNSARNADIGGLVSLGELNPDGASAHLSYCVAEQLQGRGYTTAAARTLCAAGFRERQLRQIVAGIAIENVRSERVMSNLGGSCEGVWGLSFQTKTYVRRWVISREGFKYE